MMFLVSCVYAVLVTVVLSAPSHDGEPAPGSRGHGLDNLAFHRLARPDSGRPASTDFSGGDVIRSLLTARGLDHMGGGEALRVLDPFSGGLMLRSLDRLSGGGFLDSLDHYKAGEVIAILDRLTGGDLLRSLDSSEGGAVLEALEVARRRHPMAAPKRRTLDSLSGMAFGTSKRFDTLSGVSLGVSKRNFDEIDNVGFNGFAKRGPGGGWRQLALAKKRNFDEIDRVGFGDYSKRNFDEIDRTGFEGFLKRKEGE